jgi:glycosyltransferase involved in cell wall biosynthesis
MIQQNNADKRIHVLFVIDEFFDAHGGAEGALVRMTHHLPRDRFRCSVVTFHGKNADRSVFDCPFHVFELTTILDWHAVKMAFRLRRLIRQEKVDIVHTFFETSDLWGGLVAKLSVRPLLISSRRDMGILRRSRHSLFYRLLGPMYDQVQAVSNQVREFAIREDRLNPNKVVTVYNGIEPDQLNPSKVQLTRESLGVGHASHLIISVGNVRPVKGFDVLVRAASIVCREFPKAAFLIVGHFHDVAYSDQLLALRSELGLNDNVLFLGLRADVNAILPLGDVFCLPSRSEGLSNALLEAMAHSMPAVATRVGGNPEVVEEGETGYLVESEDSKAMAEKILALLKDPGLATNMGHAGRQALERKFTVERMVSRLVSLYDSLLKKA